PAIRCLEDNPRPVRQREVVPGPGPEQQRDPSAAPGAPPRAAGADVLAAAERRLRCSDNLLSVPRPAHGASSDSIRRAEGYRSPVNPFRASPPLRQDGRGSRVKGDAMAEVEMRIGVLTGGGDCPGLNAVIRAVVRKGEGVYGHNVVGFRHGW